MGYVEMEALKEKCYSSVVTSRVNSYVQVSMAILLSFCRYSKRFTNISDEFRDSFFVEQNLSSEYLLWESDFSFIIFNYKVNKHNYEYLLLKLDTILNCDLVI
jgi:hypothetical protein